MTRSIDRIHLPACSPGTTRTVTVHRYGDAGARPKAYLQSGLHADEIPGMLALSHLVSALDEAADQGRILGEVIVIPTVNPIGIGQRMNGSLLGRYEMGGDGNFNRNWPRLTDAVEARVSDRIGPEEAANALLIREALRAAVAALPADTELRALRRAVMSESIDADIVLDVHCDNDALTHIYCGPALWPDAADLSAEVGSRATMLATDSGGDPFDEVHSLVWHELSERLSSVGPIPQACLSATVELRGQADVWPEMAAADAAALLRFLQRRGVVAGDPGPLPTPQCDATELNATEVLKTPVPGVASYVKRLGDQVREGEVVAQVVDPSADDPLGTAVDVKAGTDGLVFTTRRDKMVRQGQTIAKIVGTKPVREGRLLDD